MRKLIQTLKSRKPARSSLAIILAFSVLLTTFSGLAVFAGVAQWDGSTAASFESGTGSQDDPFIIADGAQLKYLVTLGAEATDGNYYQLANDIYLNSASTAKWYEASGLNKWPVLEVKAENAFCGNFNGAGHVVYGLYANYQTDNTTAITDATQDTDIGVATGLFPLVGAGATVDAVGVEKARIEITNKVATAAGKPAGIAGAIVGAFIGNDATHTISVSRCYAADTVHITAAYPGLIGGGATTSGEGVTVANCYSLLSWTARTSHDQYNRAGIIARSPGGAKFSGCFGLGNLAGNTVKKDAQNYVTGWDSNAAAVVARDDIYGGEGAKTKMPELDWENVYATTSTHPVLRVFNVKATEGISVWDGTEVKPAQGNGSPEDPYVIKTAENLAWAVAQRGEDGKSFILANDIYLNDLAMVNWADGAVNGNYVPNEWYAQFDAGGTSYNGGQFKGTIDGAGFTIYGLYYRPGSLNSSSALIPAAKDAVIKNLRIAKAFISGGRWNAALVGYGTNCTFDNVLVDESVTVWGYNTGGKYIDQAAIDKHVNSQPEYTFTYDKTNGAYAHFQSTGTSAIIGYANAEVVINNVAEYANIKTSGFNYTVENALVNNGNPIKVSEKGHMGGLVGTAYNTAIRVTDSISKNRPFDKENAGGNAVNSFTDVYTLKNDKGVSGVTVVSEEQLIGEAAKETLTGLDFNSVWATALKYPTLEIFNRMDPSEFWSGDLIAPSKGKGTVEEPIIISTPEELAYIVKNGTAAGAHYQLEKDIYLNDITRIDWATGTVKTGYIAKEWFSSNDCGVLDGYFDGNGHVVYGLYYNDTTAPYWNLAGAGLFPQVKRDSNSADACDTFTISKLGIECAYVCHPNGASAFVGANKGNVEIDQCYASDTVTLKGYMAGAFIGGSDSIFKLSNCYNLAKLEASLCSGLVGDNKDGQISGSANLCAINNCYNATGAIRTNGPAIGTQANNYATENGVAADTGTTVLTAAEMQGLDVVTLGKMSGLGAMFQGTTTYPILAAFTPIIPAPEAGVWDGTSKTAPIIGAGSQGNPYKIHNAAELLWVLDAGEETEGKYYKIVNDIFINEADKVNWKTGKAIDGYEINTWNYTGFFSGHLDGDGHTVYGLYYNDTAEKIAATGGHGLIKNVRGNVTIKNLGVDKAFIEDANAASAFVVVHTTNNSTLKISYCYVGEEVTISGYASAAFVGVADEAISLDHVYNLGTLKKNTHKWPHYLTGVLEPRAGIVGFYGDTWGNAQQDTSISYAYNATGPVSDRLKATSLTDVFTTVRGDLGGGEYVSAEKMQGLDVFNKKMPMQILNSDKAWQATDKYPILDIFAEDPNGPDGDEYVNMGDTDENGIWLGKIATTFSDNTSTGAKDDPIIITSPGELALAISSGGAGKYYKLANDLYLNDVNVAGWYEKDDCNTWLSGGEFNGHIDGAGHIVYGIWYHESTPSEVGLIPKMGDGSVKNIGVRYSMIRAAASSNGVGGLIGYARNVITIERCFVDETVQLSGGACTGALVGLAQQYNRNSTKGLIIRDCYTKADIAKDGLKINGLLGNPWVTCYEIYNSISFGERPYHIANGGGKSTHYWTHTVKQNEQGNFVTDISEAKPGKNAADYFKNVYSDTGGADNVDHFWTTVKKDLLYGNDASKHLKGLDFNNVWKTNKNGSPTLRIFGDKVDGEDIDTSADAAVYASGKGNKSNPYIIENAEQLRYLVTSSTTKGKYYKLANDIYVNDTSKSNWKTNASVWPTNQDNAIFAGHLEGNGHSIYGLYVNEKPTSQDSGLDYVSGTGAGLFSYVAGGAVIRNVHVRNSYISGSGNVGGLIGHTKSNANGNIEIVGCSVDGSVTLRGYTVGGLVGVAYPAGVDIYFCYATADVQGNAPGIRSNGILGDTWASKSSIMNTYTIGNPPTRDGVTGQASANYSDVSGPSFKLVPKANMYGAAAKKAMPKLKWDVVWYTANGKTPQLKVVPEGVGVYDLDEGVKGRVWKGGIATKFAGGTGTQKDPYIIETPEQLAFLVYEGGSTNDTYYKITADIKLNNTSKAGWEQNAIEWFAGGPVFKGHLDGGYHVVTGLYYNQIDTTYFGLFSTIEGGASIEKLGVATSTITNDVAELTHTYTAAFVGGVENHDGYMGRYWDGNVDTLPVISECFVAPDVTMTGDTVGGLLGGGSAGFKASNCFVSADISATFCGGGIYGELWENGESFVIIENSYVTTKGRDSMGNGLKYTETIAVFANAYVDGSIAGVQTTGITSLNLLYMKGENAKKYMPGLDYNKIWKIVTTGENGGTPVLRGFANCEKYSNLRDPLKVSIEFVTGDGASEHEAIWGYPMVTEIDYSQWPTPTRYGYKFDGWYHYDTFDLKFDLKYFPNYNCYAYAKWVQTGFTNGFEGTNNPDYDINEGCEFFQPGVKGYNPKYVHGGLRSLHTLPDSTTAPIFLLGYETKLEVGTTYDVNFWMCAKENGAAGTIDVIHSNYADVNDVFVGSELGCEFSDLKAGEWKQYRITVTANGPYLMFRTTPGVELFFDDFQVVTVEDGEGVGDILGGHKPGSFGEPFTAVYNWLLGFGVIGIIILIVGGVVLVAGIAAVIVAIVLIARKSKKKKALKAAAAAAAVEAVEETPSEE